LFVPSVKAGEKYKYYLRSRFKGYRVLKADPFGFGHEIAPQTASIVTDPGLYQWRDSEWMDRRTSFQPLDAPLSIYELHAASWKRKENGDPCNYRELADQLIPYLLDLNYTHVELLPVLEHPFEGSWGYQVTGFFAPASRYGAPDDFRYFVDSCHQAGLGVILDWVPGHFPRDQHGLHFFDGSFLYEHADPRKGEHKEWGTMIFNYGRPEVRSFLLSSALFWLKEFHIDGFRVDAVASMLYLDYSRNEGEWEPNQFGGRENLEAISFLRRFNELCHTVPGVFTVAEESTSFPAVSRPVYTGGLGFTFKWNMGWMHDMLAYFKTDPVFRKGQHQKITFSLFYAFTENFVLPISHDEVVHGKGSLISRMPGDEWQRFANVRAFLAYMYTHPGKKLLFMGQEIGQYEEWSEKRSVRWEILDFNLHRRLRDFVRTLNEIYREEPALHEVDFHWKGFDWIDFQDVDSSVISFIRRGRWIGEQIVVACNFTPVVRPSYRIGVPMAGDYDELFNSDAPEFGGSGIGSGPTLRARPGTMHGQEYSVELTLPPLAVVAYKWRAPGDLPADPKGKREELPDPLHALSGRLREEDWEVEPEWAFALSE
jgi:1,4-alpha-glucan branching enzyme